MPRAAEPRREPGRELDPADSSTSALLPGVCLLAGDESFFRDRFLAALRRQVSPAAAEFAFTAADLALTPWPEIFAQASTPSLFVPLQIFVLDNAEHLIARGAPVGFPAALAAFAAGAGQPPGAVLVFLARRLHLPADIRQISLDDKAKLEKLEALFAPPARIVRCGQATAADAAQLLAGYAQSRDWHLRPDAARLLFESSAGDLARAWRELEKLAIYAAGAPITAAIVRTLVPEAPSMAADALWAALARHDRAAALGALDQIWAAEGDAAAIPLVFQLSRFCKMALIARQARARDRQRLYQVLPVGLKPPSFAADAILVLAAGISTPLLLSALDRLQRADVALRSSPLSPQAVMETIVNQWNTPASQASK